MLDRLAVFYTGNERPHLTNEHRVVELDEIHALVTQIDLADNLIVERFVVGIGLFILRLDFIELDVYLGCSAVRIHRADDHLIDMPVMEKFGLVDQ